jgi:FkbM family methyltransferase
MNSKRRNQINRARASKQRPVSEQDHPQLRLQLRAVVVPILCCVIIDTVVHVLRESTDIAMQTMKSVAKIKSMISDNPSHLLSRQEVATESGYKGLSYIKNPESNKWRVWDAARDGILFHQELMNTTSCDWVTFRPAALPGLPPPTFNEVPMCVYSGEQNDVHVSGMIRSSGRWYECDVLSSLVYENGNELHLEVGANIGACVLQVLLTTNATIVAFEPAPTNLFILTSTLRALPMSLRDRVVLFPIGLGDKDMQSTISVSRDNRGNSVVGQEIRDFPSQEFLPPMPISIERLDSVLDVKSLPTRDLVRRSGGISSMKIDVQGHECSVVRGMLPTLAGAVHVVKFENDPKFLDASVSRCSCSILFDLFTKPIDQGGAEFDVRSLAGHTKLGGVLTSHTNELQDLLALPRGSTFQT